MSVNMPPVDYVNSMVQRYAEKFAGQDTIEFHRSPYPDATDIFFPIDQSKGTMLRILHEDETDSEVCKFLEGTVWKLSDGEWRMV